MKLSRCARGRAVGPRAQTEHRTHPRRREIVGSSGKSSCRLSPGPAARSAAPPGPGSVAAPAVAAPALAAPT
eukprot:scaffold8957_cov68-Phaeocystis_antarctica.AAC.4